MVDILQRQEGNPPAFKEALFRLGQKPPFIHQIDQLLSRGGLTHSVWCATGCVYIVIQLLMIGNIKNDYKSNYIITNRLQIVDLLCKVVINS